MADGQQYVQANGLNICYKVYGEGPPLILIHGGMGTSEDWADQIPGFARHFQVFVPESRGHGRTDNPAGSLDYRMMADDLAGFVRGLGLQRPMIYGFSDGGQIALDFGMRYPDLAQALIIAAAWFKFTDSYRASVEGFVGDAATPGVDLDALRPILGDYLDHLRTAHSHVYGEEYLPDFLAQLKALWLTPLNYTTADFQQIKPPALIVAGDRDRLISLEEAIEMYRLIPAAELCIAPNTDHGNTTASETIQHATLDFLMRHRPQVAR